MNKEPSVQQIIIFSHWFVTSSFGWYNPKTRGDAWVNIKHKLWNFGPMTHSLFSAKAFI